LLFYAVSPNITTPVEGQEFTITEGSDGSITCTATGYPPPTVVWQNSDGSSLSNMRLVSGSEVMSSTGVGNETSVSVELMVTGAMRVDTGMYTCSASNILSNNETASATMILTIQCEFQCRTLNRRIKLTRIKIINKNVCRQHGEAKNDSQ